MSNYLGVATATAVFSQKIYKALSKVKGLSAAPIVTTKRPESHDGQTVGAYIYLYQIEFNQALRNSDLPGRRADGALIQQPQVALNLKYHISFYGRETTLEALRMMGSTIVELHAEPLITPVEIKQYLDAIGPDGFLADSDLYQQKNAIKIEPITLSLEDISKIWTTFFQVPHEHSLNYEVSVIHMESDLPVTKALPAKSFSSSPNPGGVMEIEKVSPPYAEYPAQNELLEIKCKSADISTKVLFKEADVIVSPDAQSGNLLKVRIPPQVFAGINHIVLVKTWMDKGVEHTAHSAPGRIVIQPVISNVLFRQSVNSVGEANSVIQLDLMPLPRTHQTMVLLLNSLSGGVESSYSIKNILMFEIKTSSDALAKSNYDAVGAGLHSHLGISLSRRAVVKKLQEGVWTIGDKGEYFSLRLIDSRFILFYGFSTPPSATQVAFSGRQIRPGRYLARVQVEGQQFAESILVQNKDPKDVNYGRYIGPVVDVT